MLALQHFFRPGLLALAWLALTGGATLAHNGEDHSGDGIMDAPWLAVAGMVLVAVLVFRLARHRDAEPDDPGGDPDR